MVGWSPRRRRVGLTIASVAVVLTGCSSATHSAGSQMMSGSVAASAGMMGGSSGSGAASAGMMGGGSDYHHSRLTCSAPNSLPGRVVRVTLADMGMTQMMSGVAPLGSHMMLRASPATEPAGQISLIASNLGWRPHELVILPLAAGASAGQRVPGPNGKITETGSVGEASGSCAAGTGQGITAGTTGWTTVTLAPGRYELVCNLRNHYADGMYEELDIT